MSSPNFFEKMDQHHWAHRGGAEAVQNRSEVGWNLNPKPHFATKKIELQFFYFHLFFTAHRLIRPQMFNFYRYWKFCTFMQNLSQNRMSWTVTVTCKFTSLLLLSSLVLPSILVTATILSATVIQTYCLKSQYKLVINIVTHTTSTNTITGIPISALLLLRATSLSVSLILCKCHKSP